MKIWIFVTLVHLCLIGWICFERTPPKSAHRPIQVRTITIEEKKAAPKPVASSAPKPTAKPPPPKPPKPPKPSEDDGKQKALELIKKSLATLEEKPERGEGEKPSSTTLRSEAVHFGASYQEALVAYLEKTLLLPEKGDVKLHLTLSRQGQIVRVNIDASISSKNRSYVEKAIAELSFPPFEKEFKGETEHTFALTLINS